VTWPKPTRTTLVVAAALAAFLYVTGPTLTVVWMDADPGAAPTPGVYDKCLAGFQAVDGGALCVSLQGTVPSYHAFAIRAAFAGRRAAPENHVVGLFLTHPSVRLFQWTNQLGASGFGICRTVAGSRVKSSTTPSCDD